MCMLKAACSKERAAFVFLMIRVWQTDNAKHPR
jgi:hypothetical protein